MTQFEKDFIKDFAIGISKAVAVVAFAASVAFLFS